MLTVLADHGPVPFLCHFYEFLCNVLQKRKKGLNFAGKTIFL